MNIGVKREERYGFEKTLITVIIAVAMWVGRARMALAKYGRGIIENESLRAAMLLQSLFKVDSKSYSGGSRECTYKY